jgi:tetratricopeptide (TPR) repeat protein
MRWLGSGGLVVLLVVVSALAAPQISPWRDIAKTAADHLRRGQFQEAEQWYRMAVSAAESASAEDKDLAPLYVEFGRLLFLRNKSNEALQAYQQALAIYERLEGQSSLAVADVLENIGDVHYRRAVAVHEYFKLYPQAARGGGNWTLTVGAGSDSFETTSDPGKTLRESLEHAETAYTRVQAIRREHDQEEDAVMAKSFWRLGEVLRMREKYAEAEPNYLRALELLEDGDVRAQLQRAEVLADMGKLYAAWGKPAEAEQYFLQAIETWKDVPGDTSLRWMGIHQELARMYFATRQYEKAAEFYAKVLEEQEKRFGPDSGQVVLTLWAYADTLKRLKRKDEAKALEQRVKEIEKKTGTRYIRPQPPGG